MPKDDLEAARADELYAYFYDAFFSPAVDYMLHIAGVKPQPEKAKELYKNFYPIAKTALEHYSDFLKSSKYEFLISKNVSFADFVVVNHIQTFEVLDKKLVAEFPNLLAFKEKIYNLPQIKSYITNRKFTYLI